MENNNLNSVMDSFLTSKKTVKSNDDGTEKEHCDIVTGECYTIKQKDGIVERLNKRYITSDGRQLLND